jgi:small basic protein
MQKHASNRSFGLLFAGFFLIVAALEHWKQHDYFLLFAVLGSLILVISLLMPRLLAPLKRYWLKFGVLLGSFIGPVVLAVSYVFAIIPVGVLVRLFGKDLLSLKRDRFANSYWIRRELGGPAPTSLKDQF